MQVETGDRKAYRAREVSVRMGHRRDEILERWAELARAEISSARQSRGPALLNHLPNLLQIIEAKLRSDDLGPESDRNVRRISQIHGEQRVRQDYEVADVLREYQILSRVVFDVLEVDGPLAQRERNMILRDIQNASYQAIEEFVEDQRYRELEPLRMHWAWRGWKGVGLSLLGVAVGGFLQWVLWPLVKPAPYIIFYPTLILLALYAEGWTAIAGTVLVTQYIFTGEAFDWRISWPGDYARGAILILSGVLIMAVRRQVFTAQSRAYLERARSITFARLQNALAEIGRLGLSDRGDEELIQESLPLVTRALDARHTLFVPEVDAEIDALSLSEPTLTRKSGSLEVTMPGSTSPFGTIRIEAEKNRDFSVDERNFLTTAAGTLTTALQRRHSEADLRDKEDRLRAVNEELGRSNAELSRFAAIAAHDLKAPLNSISQFADLIRETQPPTEETAQYFDIMAHATDRMRNLVDRLLSYSRVGAIDAQMVAVDANQIFVAAKHDLDAAIKANGAHVTSGRLPVVRGDQVALQQLFQNLIGNALKFVSPDVPPRVHVRAKESGDDWLFSIEDNGIGIDPREAREIFEPFRRLRAHAYEGTGLGLAICLRIVERHGGKIWMESAPQRGSNFFFTLPRVNT